MKLVIIYDLCEADAGFVKLGPLLLIAIPKASHWKYHANILSLVLAGSTWLFAIWSANRELAS